MKMFSQSQGLILNYLKSKTLLPAECKTLDILNSKMTLFSQDSCDSLLKFPHFVGSSFYF